MYVGISLSDTEYLSVSVPARCILSISLQAVRDLHAVRAHYKHTLTEYLSLSIAIAILSERCM
jgi:hypothetical protein